MDSKVVVVGAGVIGLTMAITLAEKGIHTALISALRPELTTSSKAGALWHPFLVAASKRIHEWSMTTYKEHMRLYKLGEGGIVLRELREYFDQRKNNLWWLNGLSGVRRLAREEIPSNFCDGFSLEVPLIEPSRYLPYLESRFLEYGGIFKIEHVNALSELLNNFDLVVNCTGLAARELCDDRELYPISGQTVCVSSHEKITNCIIDDTKAEDGFPTYIFTRSGDILLGGIARVGDKFDRPCEIDTQDILRRTRQLKRELTACKIISVQGGDRPGRKTVRLEFDSTNDRIIHNYGHSGSGYTLCWGCAREVLHMVKLRLGLDQEIILKQ